MKSSEYVSTDMLEENFLKAYSPIRSIQMLLGSCRVDAKYRFVTSPTIAQKIYSVIFLLIILALYISVVIYYFSRFHAYPNLYYLTGVALFVHYGTFACNVINVRFINNDLNAKFYLRMQAIDRKMKIDQNNLINGFIFKVNLLTVVINLLILLILFAIAVTDEFILFIIFLGPLFAQLTSTLEWFDCANLQIYFHLRLRFINAIITNYIESKEDVIKLQVEKAIFPTMKILRSVASHSHDFESNDTDIYLEDIFAEILRFQYLYQFQVFLFCFKFVTVTLLMFEFGLLGLQYNILNWFEYILIPTVASLDLIVIAVICIRYEAFFREIKNTKYLCIKVLSRIYSGPLRQKTIKMLKMIKEKPHQFSVYDMWHMEASTMINMINLVTTLMVTLLQFALL